MNSNTEYFRELKVNNKATEEERVGELEEAEDQLKRLVELWCDNVGLSLDWIELDA